MMIQVPTPAAAAGEPAEPAAENPASHFWRHLAAAPSGTVGDADLEAALEHLATSGDEVVARITPPRVGLPRAAGLGALRSVAVDHVSRRQDLL